MAVNSATLALGTVQFGLDYGISNALGQVNTAAISAILQQAQSSQLNWLDTAYLYGSAEANLGEQPLSQQFSIITKLPEITTELNARSALSCSLQRLKRAKIDTVLLHRPEQLLGAAGAEIYQDLQALRAEGLCRRIGVSVYTPLELNAILDQFSIDVVQLPLNVFDQRFYLQGLLDRCQALGVSVHIRSLFLQGLLLMTERPAWCSAYDFAFTKFSQCAEKYQTDKLTLALSILRLLPAVELGVVGCTKAAELLEISTAWQQSTGLITLPDFLQSIQELAQTDDNLISPIRWPKKAP
jgi:aryl-alcohol dehydrogenase-like predicted oxidoreductase